MGRVRLGCPHAPIFAVFVCSDCKGNENMILTSPQEDK